MTTKYDSRPETYEHISHVRQFVLTCAMDLMRRAHSHDLSKLQAPELDIFNEWTPKLRDVDYGTPEYEECLAGMRDGLVHHYTYNDHHPEHFPNGIADMDLIQLIEMLCDWFAASMRHPHGDVVKSISEVNNTRFGYGEEIERLLLNTVRTLKRYFPQEESEVAAANGAVHA